MSKLSTGTQVGQGNGNGAALTGHALRNAHLRARSLARAQTAPPLARAVVRIRAGTLAMTRLEFARRSGLSRGVLRDLELGVHTPTRHTLQRLLAFCQTQRVSAAELEELRRLYAGPGETLGQLLGRLELRAGSSRELARRVGISPSTLWEYRRGNFPLPLALLRQLCQAAGEDAAAAEALWHRVECRRLLERGYPEAWAELCVLCRRAGHTDGHLLELGVSSRAFRRLRYLELPPWDKVAGAARALCRDAAEYRALQQRWARCEGEGRRPADGFGPGLKRLRIQQGVRRRELADLFGIGGKKPARIIKYIEEDGFYSAKAFPAALAAVLADQPAERARLLQLWQERRHQFHRRRRPEVRAELRLARELYGFGLADIAPVLGYSSREYQLIERGQEPLRESARARVLEAIHRAGQARVEEVRRRQRERTQQRSAWRTPPTLRELVARLAEREGGLAPLARHLRRAGLAALGTGRLRAIARGRWVPAWPVLEAIGRAGGVADLDGVRADWAERYRARLGQRPISPLGVELRLLIAEVARSLRDFSRRLGFSYSVLVREFQRIDRDEPLKWFHVGRILRAAGVAEGAERWREVRALWSTAEVRGKRPARSFSGSAKG
jgi:transcriptional regulator with XRE-family HTH domain